MTTLDNRREAEHLLPFLANGTLTGAERAFVEAQVDADPDLAEQARVLRQVRAEMQAETDGFSPGEFGLARLMRDIEADAPSLPKPADRRPAYAALAAAVALVAVVTGSLVLREDAGAPVYYEQASGDAADAVLTIAFRPDATQAQMTDLLLANGLVVVDGPYALGLFQVQSLDGEDLSALAERLALETEIVETVDALQ